MLGDAGVGKSCLVLRFVTGSFDKYSESTIGASFMSKLITVDSQPIKYQIWDTAGACGMGDSWVLAGMGCCPPAGLSGGAWHGRCIAPRAAGTHPCVFTYPSGPGWGAWERGRGRALFSPSLLTVLILCRVAHPTPSLPTLLSFTPPPPPQGKKNTTPWPPCTTVAQQQQS